MKASFLHTKFRHAPVAIDRTMIAPQLIEYMDHPPPASLFLPSAAMFALNHALMDAFDDLEAFMDYTVRSNRQTLVSPLYKALFLFVTPKSLVEHAGERWAKVHRGVELACKMTGKSEFFCTITYPAHLASPELVDVWGRVLAMTLDLSGAKNVELTVQRYTPTQAEYTGTWS